MWSLPLHDPDTELSIRTQATSLHSKAWPPPAIRCRLDSPNSCYCHSQSQLFSLRKPLWTSVFSEILWALEHPLKSGVTAGLCHKMRRHWGVSESPRWWSPLVTRSGCWLFFFHKAREAMPWFLRLRELSLLSISVINLGSACCLKGIFPP